MEHDYYADARDVIEEWVSLKGVDIVESQLRDIINTIKSDPDFEQNPLIRGF